MFEERFGGVKMVEGFTVEVVVCIVIFFFFLGKKGGKMQRERIWFVCIV